MVWENASREKLRNKNPNKKKYFMKKVILILLFVTSGSLILNAQNDNNLDQRNIKIFTTRDTLLKEGVYKIYYNTDWKIIDPDENAPYYRIIKISSQGLPYDTVRDYYLRGDILQWKSRASSFIPNVKLKNEGVSTWYGIYGNITSQGYFINGVRMYNISGVFKDGLYKAESINNGIKKVGVIDKYGKEVIPVAYDDVADFSEGLSLVKLDDYFGFVDKAGKEVIPLDYFWAGSFTEGLAPVGTWHRSSTEFENYYGIGITFNIIKDTIVIESIISNGPADRAGLMIGDRIVTINEINCASVGYKNEDAYRNLRSQEESQITLGILRKKINHPINLTVKRERVKKIVTGVGFINKKNEIVIPPNYQNASNFNSGLAAVLKNNKWGYINKNGVEVTEFKYDSRFGANEGLIRVQMDDKWGFIDLTGKEVIPVIYDEINQFSNGLSIVKLNGKYGGIDRYGETIIPFNFDWIGGSLKPGNFALNLEAYVYEKLEPITDFENSLVNVKIGNKYGYINRKGKIVIPIKYEDAMAFSKGLACAKIDDKFGIIDTVGNVVLPFIYWNAIYFSSNGIAKVIYSYLDNSIQNNVYINTKGEAVGISEVTFPHGGQLAQLKILESAQEKKYFVIYYDKSNNSMGWCFNSDKETASNNALRNCKSFGGGSNAEMVMNENRVDLYGALIVASNEYNNYWVLATSHYSIDDAEKNAKDKMQNEYNISDGKILSSWSPNDNISSGYKFSPAVITSRNDNSSNSSTTSSSNALDHILNTATNVVSVLNSQKGLTSSNYNNSTSNSTSHSNNSPSTCICSIKHCLNTIELYCDGGNSPCGIDIFCGTLVSETRCCIGRGTTGQVIYKANTGICCWQYGCNGFLAYDQTFFPAGPGPNTFVKFKEGTYICFITADEKNGGRDDGRVNRGTLAEAATINGTYYPSGSTFLYDDFVLCGPK